ncbi:hypothetical protein AGMMS49928_15990 [Spirochaetia bacterium]|nr:hypothetical protein AGMMS49928_15990 [Spirochaetia bacterium]
MNRRLFFFTLLLMIGGLGGLVAQTVQVADDASVPLSLRNNRYYLESVRLNALAQSSYEEGDYDASSSYAEDSLRYAYLSDEYVALQLRIRAANQAMAAAKSRLGWAASASVPQRYPDEYGRASTEYGRGQDAMDAEDWDEALAAANRALIALENVDGLPDGKILPAQYTVRAWNVSKDCLWNIAGRPWVYGNPQQWRLLYNANRSKLDDPDNPNIIEPGMVLDIPPIKGEPRQGMWDDRVQYEPLR